MTRLAALLFIALLTVAILLFLTNPELLEEVWLWIIGFIGYIIALVQKGFQSVKELFKRETVGQDKEKKNINIPPPVVDSTKPSGETHPKIDQLQQKIAQLEQQLNAGESAYASLSANTLTVLRYIDDGESTLGLLFLRKKFFAYTLEDTFRKEKIAGKTRVPEGVYPLDFNKNLTPLTRQYQKSRPWFDYHLEIKNIPDFQNVYLHVGNTHKDTEGCLLIADGIDAASTSKMITYSRKAYERFYKTIGALLKSGEEVRISIMDEDWFERSKLQTT
ncbi:hypothetical protein OKW21_006034 [Catalinimonas alkaloidigena]|uniref:DUF5675 family protein n=1 Tax=Catalinimonas alkaloidigena TaxID=1075417 RepID=UPI0024049243|nr:DUF5675 family protein [Catalinimonas alkaloidigena]MDF9800771.1 hypothetical protein [Catalinimonas alkaloidigena]